ncbi:heat stress transcription factor B-4-like protein [Tanacetum coccineum]
MYVSGHVDIFDMVDIDMFTVVALNMMVVQLGYTGESEPMFYNYLRPLTSLDIGLYALVCEEDVRCLANLVRSFKLIEVYIEHGVAASDSYIRPPLFRAIIEEITDKSGCNALVEHRSKKMLLLTCHDSSELIEEPICESVTPRSLTEHDSNPPCKAFIFEVIDDVMRQLSFKETELDGEAGFADVMRSGVEIFGLSHDESFGVDDLDLNLNEPGNAQFFYDDERIDTAYETEYDVQSSEEAGTNDDDEMNIFCMDVPFDNIGVTHLVPDDVLEGEDVDVINADGFDSDPGNDDETSNYRRRRRNLKLYKNESVRIRAICDGKVLVFTMSQGTGPNGSNCGMEVGPSGSSSPSTRSKKRKNTDTNDDSQACFSVLDAHDKGDLCPWVLYVGKDKIFDQVKVNPDILVKAVQDQLQHDLESTNPNTTVKIAVERNIDPSLPTRVFQRIYVCLGALKLGFRACRKDLSGLDGAFMKGPFPCQVLAVVGLDSNNGIYPLAYALVEAESKSSWCWFLQCLGDDIDLHPNSNFTFMSDRQKGIIPAIKTVFPSAEHRYCLRHIHENMKQGWCGQAYKDLLWRSASTTSVKEIEKCRAKFDLLLNNICEVFNGKIVRGRDKSVITLLEYIREYCMKRIVNVQSFLDKCTGPLTHTATRIMESINKEAHFMKVQWNGANKYQVLGSLGDHLLEYGSELPGDTTPRSVGKSILLVDYIEGNILLQGRPKKKRKRSKHEDEPFVKDGKLSKKGRTITCQSYKNIGYNKATCKGQGRKATTGGNNSEASGSASRQAQQTEPAVGQDGSGGSGVGAVIGFFAADGVGGPGGAGGAGVVLAVKVHTILDGQREEYKQNADGREMGDGIPTQSSAVGGAISDNGKFPTVDEEDSPSDSLPAIVITKNKSTVSDGKFLMVNEDDLIFEKISPMAEEIMVMLREDLGKKKFNDIVWYNDEIREQVEKVADGFRDIVSYFVEKAMKNYADHE